MDRMRADARRPSMEGIPDQTQSGMIVQSSGMLALVHEDRCFDGMERMTSDALNLLMAGKLQQAQPALMVQSSNLLAIVHEDRSVTGVGDTSAEDEMREVQGHVGNLSPRSKVQKPQLGGATSSLTALNLEPVMVTIAKVKTDDFNEVLQVKK